VTLCNVIPVSIGSQAVTMPLVAAVFSSSHNW